MHITIETVIVILMIAAILIGLAAIIIRRPSRAVSLTANFNTITELRNRVEFEMLLETTTPAQAKALATAFNTAYGITTVDDACIETVVSATSAANTQQAQSIFKSLKSIN